MSPWNHWLKAVQELRPACTRSRTFLWMLLALAGLCSRLKLPGPLGLSMQIDADQQSVNATWDFGRIGQLLSNLLENSLRYTQAPGQIRVHWRADSTALTLTVEDSAPGVAPALMPKLFEPLFRVDAARTRTGQHGSGLGLSIVQAIVRAHRGSVAASNSPQGGVAITVQLPIQPQRLERRQRTT